MTKRRHQNLHLQSLTISFLNVCSIRYKQDEIRDFIASWGVSIFAVAETWLKPNTADGEVDIPHFNLFRKDRINHRGGGVELYCHEGLQIRRRSDLEDRNIELLWADVQAGNQKIMLGCCYRPPEAA